MPFAWREYLDVAKFLATAVHEQPMAAAFARCAVSRAYYAAFCHARNHARDADHFEPAYDASDHARVREHFRHSQTAVANRLDMLRQWRNQCDYCDEVPGLHGLPAKAISLAQRVIDELV